MSRATIKSGASLRFDATVVIEGKPVDMTGWTVTCQVRTVKGVLVGSVQATLQDQTVRPGEYYLHAQTVGWIVGQHAFDIAYSYPDGLGGQTVLYSETIPLYVEPAMTTLGT
jgi:hypothetical protein